MYRTVPHVSSTTEAVRDVLARPRVLLSPEEDHRVVFLGRVFTGEEDQRPVFSRQVFHATLDDSGPAPKERARLIYAVTGVGAGS